MSRYEGKTLEPPIHLQLSKCGFLASTIALALVFPQADTPAALSLTRDR